MAVRTAAEAQLVVTAADQAGNVMSRPLVTFRLDFHDSPHKEWMEMICLQHALGHGNINLECNSFAAGKRYRLVANRTGSLIEFHPVRQEFPSFFYQGWKRCLDNPTNCYRISDHPIQMIKLATGDIER